MRFAVPALLALTISGAALAQQQEQVIPFQLQLPKRESGVYTTKQPPRSPQQQYPQGYVPFGRATPDAMVPVPTGPRTTESAPVTEVEGMEASEPVYSDIVAQELPEAVQDPTKTTQQTGTVFEAKDAAPRAVQLRALNKVTGHAIVMSLPAGAEEMFGNLKVRSFACRAAMEHTQPDSAALLDIREQRKDEKEDKPLFSGWMFASSASLTGLEHPVYDISVVACEGGPAVAKKEEKIEEKSEPTS